MAKDITLIDRGRGMQLSTSRITVADLVPYFRGGCSHEEIIRWIPTLTSEEIAVVEAYYRRHKDELDEKDRRVEEYREEQTRLQRLRFSPLEGTKEQIMSQLRERLRRHIEEKNGARHPAWDAAGRIARAVTHVCEDCHAEIPAIWIGIPCLHGGAGDWLPSADVVIGSNQ
jgi:uncharacterized protein (DUF433 family)